MVLAGTCRVISSSVVTFTDEKSISPGYGWLQIRVTDNTGSSNILPVGANPIIQGPIQVFKADKDAFEPVALSSRDLIQRIFELSHAVDLEWVDDTATGRLYSSVTIPFSRSMLENILRGLVKDQDGRQRMDPTDLVFERVDESRTMKLGFRKKGMVGLNIN